MRRRQSHDAQPDRDRPSSSVDLRLKYLRLAIAIAFIVGILFSRKLWFGFGRSFPRLPLITGLPDFGSSADFVLSLLLLVALGLSVITKKPRRYLIAVVILTASLVLLDQTRLQPWVYQYAVMLALLACQRGDSNSPNSSAPILYGCQLVIALLYFWSGVQKLKWSFGHEVMLGLFEAARIHLPAASVTYLPKLGIAVALCEAAIGAGLMIRRTRKTAVVLALATHLLVLLMLLVAHRNSAVWPWNVSMMILVVLLFWRFDGSLARRELWRWRGFELATQLPRMVVIICGLAPALSFVGWWDLYLSAALYSGNTAVAVIRINDDVRGRLSDKAQQQLFSTKSGELMLPVYEWSMAELNVPPYPEARTYRQLTRQVCAFAADQNQIELIVKERPALLDGSYKVTQTPCADLER